LEERPGYSHLHNMELRNLYYSSGSISITNEEGCSGQGMQPSQYT